MGDSLEVPSIDSRHRHMRGSGVFEHSELSLGEQNRAWLVVDYQRDASVGTKGGTARALLKVSVTVSSCSGEASSAT